MSLIDINYKQEYPAIYRGIVEDNVDPENLGRCKVRVPSVHGELTYPISILPWARPLVVSPVKKGRGSVNIPDIGDIVWVFFEGSNRDFPIYVGGVYAKDELDILNDRVDFYTEDGDRISYSRNARIYDIKIGERRIIVTPELINIKGNTLIEGDLHVTGTASADVDVYGAGTSLHTHTHGGVEPGGGSTGKPN